MGRRLGALPIHGRTRRHACQCAAVFERCLRGGDPRLDREPSRVGASRSWQRPRSGHHHGHWGGRDARTLTAVHLRLQVRARTRRRGRGRGSHPLQPRCRDLARNVHALRSVAPALEGGAPGMAPVPRHPESRLAFRGWHHRHESHGRPRDEPSRRLRTRSPSGLRPRIPSRLSAHSVAFRSRDRVGHDGRHEHRRRAACTRAQGRMDRRGHLGREHRSDRARRRALPRGVAALVLARGGGGPNRKRLPRTRRAFLCIHRHRNGALLRKPGRRPRDMALRRWCGAAFDRARSRRVLDPCRTRIACWTLLGRRTEPDRLRYDQCLRDGGRRGMQNGAATFSFTASQRESARSLGEGRAPEA